MFPTVMLPVPGTESSQERCARSVSDPPAAKAAADRTASVSAEKKVKALSNTADCCSISLDEEEYH